jgi:uncharacterized protein DUF664
MPTTPMTDDTATTTGQPVTDRERADLVDALTRHRAFLRFTVRGLTEEQALSRPTASALCLGGLIKHVAATEATWAEFTVRGAAAFPTADWTSPEAAENWAREWQLQPGETLGSLLEHYTQVAERTDELVRTLPSLDVEHRLPEAPWFTPGASQSARRVFLHIIAETAQHAGHADILRETIDGQKTMG